MLEKLRLSAWKKNPVPAEKDNETKDAPKICENNGTSVTKGVKFAVSMFILVVIGYILSKITFFNCRITNITLNYIF